MYRRLFAPVLLLALPAAASDPLAGRVAGPPSACIDLRADEGPEASGDRTLLYRESTRRIWRTEPDGRCRAFRPFTTVIAETNGRRLCRGDRFRVTDPADRLPSAACLYGAFVPYDLPARHR